MKRVLVVAFFAVTSLAAFAAEPPGPAAKPDAGKAAPIAQQVCVACHGSDGNSALPVNPNLAGQHAQYTTKQLANFKSGDRKNPIMSAMAANLSPADMANLGAYFATQKPKPSAARDRELAEAGQKLYRAGNRATGLPACAGCHGPAGSGIPAEFPRLAGQHADYVLAQLKSFRAWERSNDSAKMMRMVAGKLSDADMQALAEYLSGLRP